MAKVKICGLCREIDAEYANMAMPDYAGFVFAQSKRQVNAEKALWLRRELDKRITCVGVFVNEKLQTMMDIFESGCIQIVQLHGHESPETVEQLKKEGIPVIKAIRMDERESNALKYAAADYLLLDNGIGGTGRPFDWNKIQNFSKPFFLAGGLSCENVLRALQEVNPYAVDVSSGVETVGMKDKNKMIEFIRRVRTAKTEKRG